MLLFIGKPKDERQEEIPEGDKEPAEGGCMDRSREVSFVFAQGICHGILVSYANIYSKKGIMQNIVLIFNI